MVMYENSEDFEKELLIKELVAMHNIQENPDFEEQVREILKKYVVFRRNRLHETIK